MTGGVTHHSNRTSHISVLLAVVVPASITVVASIPVAKDTVTAVRKSSKSSIQSMYSSMITFFDSVVPRKAFSSLYGITWYVVR